MAIVYDGIHVVSVPSDLIYAATSKRFRGSRVRPQDVDQFVGLRTVCSVSKSNVVGLHDGCTYVGLALCHSEDAARSAMVIRSASRRVAPSSAVTSSVDGDVSSLCQLAGMQECTKVSRCFAFASCLITKQLVIMYRADPRMKSYHVPIQQRHMHDI